MEGQSQLSPDRPILSHHNNNVSTPATPISPGVNGSKHDTSSESHDTPETPMGRRDEQSSDDREMFADEKLVTLSDAQIKHVKKIFSLFEIPRKKVIEPSSLGSLLRW